MCEIPSLSEMKFLGMCRISSRLSILFAADSFCLLLAPPHIVLMIAALQHLSENLSLSKSIFDYTLELHFFHFQLIVQFYFSIPFIDKHMFALFFYLFFNHVLKVFSLNWQILSSFIFSNSFLILRCCFLSFAFWSVFFVVSFHPNNLKNV